MVDGIGRDSRSFVHPLRGVDSMVEEGRERGFGRRQHERH